MIDIDAVIVPACRHRRQHSASHSPAAAEFDRPAIGGHICDRCRRGAAVSMDHLSCLETNQTVTAAAKDAVMRQCSVVAA